MALLTDRRKYLLNGPCMPQDAADETFELLGADGSISKWRERQFSKIQTLWLTNVAIRKSELSDVLDSEVFPAPLSRLRESGARQFQNETGKDHKLCPLPKAVRPIGQFVLQRND